MKRWMVLALLVLSTAGCGDLFEPAAAVVRGNKITVDEVQIAVDDFVETDAFKQQAAQGDESAIKRGFEQGYLSQLIMRAVLEPEAEKLDVSVSPEEVDERMSEIAGDFPSQSAFEEAVREQGLTLDQLEDLVYNQLLQEGLRAEVTADLAPTEEELRAFYEDNEADFEQTRAQHILVEDRSLAAELADRIQKAGAKDAASLFDRLAAQHSTDEGNAKQGGDLGFSSPGDFVPAFERAMADLEIGEVSDPVRTQFGYHVIRVIDRRLQPFEDVQEQIASEISGSAQEQAWTDWLVEAFREADIEVNPRYGEFDVESRQVVDPSAESVPGADVPQREPAEGESGD